MEHYELQVLADFLRDQSVEGDQTTDTLWKPTPKAGAAELDAHEVAELVFMEIFSPVTGAGVAEILKKVYPVLDGHSYENLITLSGVDTYNMAPSRTNILARQLLALGVPMVNAVRQGDAMLAGTCPKYRSHITIEALAGGTITQDYRVRLWGYRYEAADLPRVIGSVGGEIAIADVPRNRTLRRATPVIRVTEETWTRLPGGNDQAVPKINPFLHYAFNAKATTANTPYEFRYDTADVTDRVENLYFAYDVEPRALLVKGIGVRAPANLLKTCLWIDGNPHPKSWIPTTQENNPIHFGRGYPLYPQDHPVYMIVPKLDKPYLVATEKGALRVQDDGTSIAANAIIVALNGVLIETG